MLDEWFWATFEPTPTWPYMQFTVGQFILWNVAYYDQLWQCEWFSAMFALLKLFIIVLLVNFFVWNEISWSLGEWIWATCMPEPTATLFNCDKLISNNQNKLWHKHFREHTFIHIPSVNSVLFLSNLGLYNFIWTSTRMYNHWRVSDWMCGISPLRYTDFGGICSTTKLEFESISRICYDVPAAHRSKLIYKYQYICS